MSAGKTAASFGRSTPRRWPSRSYPGAGETRVEAKVHHLNCRPEQPECTYAWVWDPAIERLVERPSRDGVTRLEGGGFDPLDPDRANLPDNLPAALSRAWFGGRKTCRAYNDDGVEVLRPRFQSVPDLNGDGARDWIETPALCVETEADAPSFKLWVTTAEGELVEGYVSGADRYPSVDIAAVPATVLENPACGPGETCPDVRLRWTERAGRFVRIP